MNCGMNCPISLSQKRKLGAAHAKNASSRGSRKSSVSPVNMGALRNTARIAIYSNGFMPCGWTDFVRWKNAGRFLTSEEHTSELQSLMRSSYADSCLNKTISLHHHYILYLILCTSPRLTTSIYTHQH